jgi:hypothetical protein
MEQALNLLLPEHTKFTWAKLLTLLSTGADLWVPAPAAFFASASRLALLTKKSIDFLHKQLGF